MFKNPKKIKQNRNYVRFELLHDMVYKNYNYNTIKLLFTIVILYEKL